MTKTLHWKKTIGLLASISGGILFICGLFMCPLIDAYKKYYSYQPNNNDYTKQLFQDYFNWSSFLEVMAILSMITLFCLSILGIISLCVEKKLTDEMPRPISCKISLVILITSSIILSIGLLSCLSSILIIHDVITKIMLAIFLTIIIVIGYSPIIVLTIFCSLGLKNKTNSIISNRYNQTSLDTEIAELKKQIEKRKLEKEIEQINTEKQTEIEKLKKELSELG